MDLSAIVAVVGFVVTLIVQAIGIGVFIGNVRAFKDHVKENFQRLEKKQDKHNNLIERTCKVESSTSSSHHRIDGIMEILNELLRRTNVNGGN